MTPAPEGRGAPEPILRREALEGILHAALAAVDAGRAVRRAVAREPDGTLRIAGRALPPGPPVTVLAVGKAAVPMARAFVEVAGERVAGGAVTTKDGHGGEVPGLAVREAAHPVPDARGEAAARDALRRASEAGPDDALVVLLSGGASALWACPAPGLGLDDLAATTDVLLASGADIGETNAVRKHLSAVAGGRLARAFAGGPVFLLAVSDVPGDRLDVIGSGPCSPDPTRFADARRVLVERGVEARVPEAVRAHLAAGERAERPETPRPGDRALARVHAHVVARNADALVAAARAARERGWRAEIDPEPLAGEARAAARSLLARARAGAAFEVGKSDAVADGLLARARAGGAGPRLWIAGGETSVTFEQAGRGGRSQELALAAALALDGERGVALLAAGTDGTDGPTDAAGAFADGGSVARARARGADARDALVRHDSYTFWSAEGGLLRTGPTGTNVMDVAFVALA